MNPLEARRRLLGRNVYKRTTEGNPAIAQGSLARMYPGITMQGWTEQAQYEGSQLFDKNASIVGLLNADGSINNTQGYHTTDFIHVVPDQKNYCTETKSYRGKYYDENKIAIQTESYEEFSFYNSGYITIPQNVSYIRFSINDDVINAVMLNSGSTALPYEPYTGGQPSPSPDYPQPITSAGKYNEETGKWEYEITIANAQTDPDKNQSVTLTADRPLTKWDKLEKRNGQWGWVYKSGSYTMTGNEGFISSGDVYHGEETSDAWIINNDMYSESDYEEIVRGYCERLRRVYSVWTIDGAVGFTYNKNQIHIRLRNSDTGVTAEDTLTDVANKIKAYVAQKYQEGNPFIFWYETAEETFVSLSESEQELMNALHTFRPTTVLSNDAGCNMTLTYKTKKSMGGVTLTD